jgi:hypothetical protein
MYTDTLLQNFIKLQMNIHAMNVTCLKGHLIDFSAKYEAAEQKEA